MGFDKEMVDRAVAELKENRKELFDKVKKHMGWDDEKTELWFSTKNPAIGAVPNYFVVLGRIDKLNRIIDALIEENNAADVSKTTKDS